MINKYKDKIVKHGTTTYWNKYYDTEVVGKKWLCEYPDGTSEYLNYGWDAEFSIQMWISKHPEYSEVINGTHKDFFDILKRMKNSSVYNKRKNKIWYKEQLQKYKLNNDKSMTSYYKNKLIKNKKWNNESVFWNIETNNQRYNIDKIKENLEEYWLVNVDIHN